MLHLPSRAYDPERPGILRGRKSPLLRRCARGEGACPHAHRAQPCMTARGRVGRLPRAVALLEAPAGGISRTRGVCRGNELSPVGERVLTHPDGEDRALYVVFDGYGLRH